MKREGWQHGNASVKVSRNKLLRIAAAAAADGEEDEGAVAVAVAVEKAAAGTKPTNASRSTGRCRRPRCRGCHDHPATKARDKAKGAHKLRACDVALNHRLVSWRVVDGVGGKAALPRDYKGASASAVLAYLAGSGGGNSWYEEDDDNSLETAAVPPGGAGLSDLYDLIVGRRAAASDGKEVYLARPADLEIEEEDTDDAVEEQEEQEGVREEKAEEDDLGFCMVGITIALEFSDGEEDWIVVEEI